MDDPFALLGLPRKPWLDEAAIRAAFQKRARELHPDAPDGDAEKFAPLNAANAAISDPAARLQLLSGLDAPHALPADVEFGFRIGSMVRDADAAVAGLAAARNTLERAMASTEVARVRTALEALARELELRLEQSREELRVLDAVWPDVEPRALATLAAEFRFLQRWRAQIRERELALSVAG